jgi:hypothetical protein
LMEDKLGLGLEQQYHGGTTMCGVV